MTITADASRRDEATVGSQTCTLDIAGMTCSSCVRRIEKALHKLDGVSGAQVNLATEVATVSDDAGMLDIDALADAVAAAGVHGDAPARRRTGQQHCRGAGTQLSSQLGLPLHVYYETSLIIVALVLAGKWMEARAKRATAAAVTALVGLAPKTARVVRDGLELDIPVEQVTVGDVVRIRPGEKIPSTASSRAARPPSTRAC